MSVARRVALFLATVGLAATVVPWTASAQHRSAPHVSALATFGSGLGSGSTIGPDGALYVTDGNAGSVMRINRVTGQVTTYGAGLPTQVLGIGGAMDVAFIGRTAYVLVTMVSGEIVGEGPFGNPTDTVGIYRLKRDGSFSVFADIGTWSIEHPPAPSFFITTGVQYAMQPYRGGFLVTDGHHNRVLRVDRNGEISSVVTMPDLVPTGIERVGERVFFTQLGPIPHHPEDGKVLELHPATGQTTELASGASMVLDVERGPGGTLYALSQGQWNGVGEGSPAFANTGRLVTVRRDGTLRPVTDGTGSEIVLDRPTSLEIVGHTAFVVSLGGDVVRIDDL
jgi:sugar lactone lactonase YvrE